MIRILFLPLLLLPLSTAGVAASGGACPKGSFTVVNSPDGSSVSVLFDQFTITGSKVGTTSITCRAVVPLNLPEGYSLGVYRIDYRGFAEVEGKNSAELNVSYALGPNKTKSFRRRVKGRHSGEFMFTENIGAGLMKRIGCGSAAQLDMTAGLTLTADGRYEDTMAGLDTLDGSERGGVTFKFDLKKCGKKG